MLEPNIGKADRIVRIVTGVILTSIGVWTPGAQWVAYVGLIPLFSGLFGFCFVASLCNGGCGCGCQSGGTCSCGPECSCKKQAEQKSACGCGTNNCSADATPPAA